MYEKTRGNVAAKHPGRVPRKRQRKRGMAMKNGVRALQKPTPRSKIHHPAGRGREREMHRDTQEVHRCTDTQICRYRDRQRQRQDKHEDKEGARGGGGTSTARRGRLVFSPVTGEGGGSSEEPEVAGDAQRQDRGRRPEHSYEQALLPPDDVAEPPEHGTRHECQQPEHVHRSTIRSSSAVTERTRLGKTAVTCRPL